MKKNAQIKDQVIFKKHLRIIVLLVLLFVSSFNDVKSQNSIATDKVEFSNISAIHDQKKGILLKWQTSYQYNVIGFDIYRLENGEPKKINTNLIPGSVFNVGQNQPYEWERNYSWFDETGTLEIEYYVESITINGNNQKFFFNKVYDAESLNQFRNELKNSPANSEGNQQTELLSVPKTSTAQMSSNLTADSLVTVFDTQRAVAEQPGVKISIKKDGLYRVTRQELINAGFDVSTSTTNWQLYTDGIEQGILITNVNGTTGVLNTNGYLEFYGRRLDTRYTNSHIYYLINGSTAGKRMNRGLTRPRVSSSQPSTFSSVVELKERKSYFPKLINGESENFIGASFAGADFQGRDYPATLTLNVPDVNTLTAQASLDISIQGLSYGTHQTNVFLNNTQIGTIAGSSFAANRRVFTFPTNLLISGNNILRLSSGGTISDLSGVDYVRITYVRESRAINDQLTFRSAANAQTVVTNFTTPSVRVFDVTNSSNPTMLLARTTANNGTYFLTITSATRARNMIALTDANVLTADSITSNEPSNIYTTAQNKDLIIVTHSSLQAPAQNLANYRIGQGYSVAVVNVEDVFDEFSYGASTPKAIKDFLQVARPRYALMFGDSSYDPRNYLNQGFGDYVPIAFTDTEFGEAASDEMLVDFDNNSIGDFPIGRIPVRNTANGQLIVNKIINFEQQIANTNPFDRGVLLISDNTDDSYNFYAHNQYLSQQLPAGTTSEYVKRTDGTAATVRTTIKNKINQGPYIVNFSGHGGRSYWTSGEILRSQDVADLTNSNKLSLFVLLTCLNGSFVDPYADSISESMLKAPNGGAAAVWASSAETIAFGQNDMSLKFFELLRLAASNAKLGDLTKTARAGTNDLDVRKSWILFGDPLMTVK